MIKFLRYVLAAVWLAAASAAQAQVVGFIQATTSNPQISTATVVVNSATTGGGITLASNLGQKVLVYNFSRSPVAIYPPSGYSFANYAGPITINSPTMVSFTVSQPPNATVFVSYPSLPFVSGGAVIATGAPGVLCNGSNNDTLGLQALITGFAGVNRIVIPKNAACEVSSTLVLPSYSHLQIEGMIQLMANSNVDVVDIGQNATMVVVDGKGTGVIDGNSNLNTGPGDSAGIGTQSNGPASNVLIENIQVQNTHNWGLNAVGISGIYVYNSSFVNAGSANEFAAGTNACWADRIVVKGVHGDQGFSFYGGVTNCGISDSDISGANAGIYVYNDTNQTAPDSHITIAHNIVHGNTGPGIAVVFAGTSLQPHTDIVISGNQSFGNGTTNGSPSADIWIANGNRVLVEGNQIHHDGNGAYEVDGVWVSNGIHGSYAQNVTVKGNQIYDEGQGGTLGVCIRASNVPNLQVLHNVCYDDQTTQTMYWALQGSAGPNNVFDGNVYGPLGGTNWVLFTYAVDTIETSKFVGSGVVQNVPGQQNNAQPINVLTYVSGSNQTCTISSGSGSTLNTSGNCDFRNGHGMLIPYGGGASAVTAAPANLNVFVYNAYSYPPYGTSTNITATAAVASGQTQVPVSLPSDAVIANGPFGQMIIDVTTSGAIAPGTYITASSLITGFTGNATLTLSKPTAGAINSGDVLQIIYLGHRNVANWQASTSYSLGSVIMPLSGNAGGYVFQAIAQGTSGTSAPTFPQTVGSVVLDGSVIWINIGYATMCATYAVAAYDSKGGLGPAAQSSQICGPDLAYSFPSKLYYAIEFSAVTNANGYAIWRSIDPYGSAPAHWKYILSSAVNGRLYSGGPGYQFRRDQIEDLGKDQPLPIYFPPTPPTTATNEYLITSVTSGAGSGTLTISPALTNASLPASTVVYHDDTTAFANAINAANAAHIPLFCPQGTTIRLSAPAPQLNFSLLGQPWCNIVAQFPIPTTGTQALITVGGTSGTSLSGSSLATGMDEGGRSFTLAPSQSQIFAPGEQVLVSYPPPNGPAVGGAANYGLVSTVESVNGQTVTLADPSPVPMPLNPYQVAIGIPLNWQASTNYTTGTTILPLVNNSGGYVYQATIGGTSATSAPQFNQTVGGITTDGTVIWTNIGTLATVSANTLTLTFSGNFPGSGLSVPYTITSGDASGNCATAGGVSVAANCIAMNVALAILNNSTLQAARIRAFSTGSVVYIMAPSTEQVVVTASPTSSTGATATASISSLSPTITPFTAVPLRIENIAIDGSSAPGSTPFVTESYGLHGLLAQWISGEIANIRSSYFENGDGLQVNGAYNVTVRNASDIGSGSDGYDSIALIGTGNLLAENITASDGNGFGIGLRTSSRFTINGANVVRQTARGFKTAGIARGTIQSLVLEDNGDTCLGIASGTTEVSFANVYARGCDGELGNGANIGPLNQFSGWIHGITFTNTRAITPYGYMDIVVNYSDINYTFIGGQTFNNNNQKIAGYSVVNLQNFNGCVGTSTNNYVGTGTNMLNGTTMYFPQCLSSAPKVAVTFTPGSGTSYAWNGSGMLDLSCSVTFNPTSTAAATASLAIGPASPPTTVVDSQSEPAGLPWSGIIHTLHATVPPSWYYALTFSNASVSTGACTGVAH
jgi:hypothetical protein